MKSNASWLIGAAAFALAACSDGGQDQAGAGDPGEIGSEISTNAAETEATTGRTDQRSCFSSTGERRSTA
jgi:hypothetical protein